MLCDKCGVHQVVRAWPGDVDRHSDKGNRLAVERDIEILHSSSNSKAIYVAVIRLGLQRHAGNPYAKLAIDALARIAQCDNEENALLALGTIAQFGQAAKTVAPALIALIPKYSSRTTYLQGLLRAIEFTTTPENGAVELARFISASRSADVNIWSWAFDELERIGPPALPALNSLKLFSFFPDYATKQAKKVISSIRSRST
jgi:hypothetical protein